MIPQATIEKSTSVAGLGIHTGRLATLTFCPAPPDTGVVFRRTDLPDAPPIPARIAAVSDTQRSTSLGAPPAIVRTIEHILAAVYCLDITNIFIDVNAPETPLIDGSSLPYTEALCEAGRVEQEGSMPELVITHPVAIDVEGMTICALPADEYKISYLMDYPHPILRTQFLATPITRDAFLTQIGPARTFALYAEIEQLMSMGLIKGGSLDNAIVITDEAILSNNGLRFPNEFVRHKIVDLIGDLSLTGRRIKGHIVSIRSGHTLNVKMAKKLCEEFPLMQPAASS